MGDQPRYLLPYQLAQLLGVEPERFRDWLRQERKRGRERSAPPEHWVSPTQRTYDVERTSTAWANRRGRGRPSKAETSAPPPAT